MSHLTEHKSGLLNLFTSEATNVDAQVVQAANMHHLASEVLDFLNENGIINLPCGLSENGEWAEVVTHLQKNGITIIPNPGREILESHGVGLNAADFGIAENGTLVFMETSSEDVRIGTVPGIHIALLQAGNIFENSSGLTGEIEKFISSQLASGQPSRVSFVTGPSRTADIECDLTIGVHGPEMLVIFILR